MWWGWSKNSIAWVPPILSVFLLTAFLWSSRIPFFASCTLKPYPLQSERPLIPCHCTFPLYCVLPATASDDWTTSGSSFIVVTWYQYLNVTALNHFVVSLLFVNLIFCGSQNALSISWLISLACQVCIWAATIIYFELLTSVPLFLMTSWHRLHSKFKSIFTFSIIYLSGQISVAQCKQVL